MTDLNYYQSLPKKRMGAGVLLFNQQDQLLIVKPNYKDHWLIPGGVVDQDESPKVAVIREIKEELNLDIEDLEFLCVDYRENKNNTGDNLQFIFLGSKLTEEQIKLIKIQESELEEYQFIEPGKAIKLLSQKSDERVRQCLEAIKNKKAIYLENGKN